MYFIIIFLFITRTIIIININFDVPKWKQYNFPQKFKRQVNENIHYLIKFIYIIFWIIKKNIKFENYYFSLKKKILKPYFFYLQSKTPRNVTKKINKT